MQNATEPHLWKDQVRCILSSTTILEICFINVSMFAIIYTHLVISDYCVQSY